MGISPYLRRLREAVGHELLLVPSVAVLAWDDDGRLLLVREAAEEAGVSVHIVRIRDVVGGPRFRQRYPNGDLVGYVPTVFDAHVVDGVPRADGDETIEVRWFSPRELGAAALTEFTRTLFEAVGVTADS